MVGHMNESQVSHSGILPKSEPADTHLPPTVPSLSTTQGGFNNQLYPVKRIINSPGNSSEKDEKLSDSFQPSLIAMQQKINEKLFANQNVPQQQQQLVMSSKANLVNYLNFQKIPVNDTKPKNNLVMMETQNDCQRPTFFVQQSKPLNTFLAMAPKTENNCYFLSENETLFVDLKPGETVPQKTAFVMNSKNENYHLPNTPNKTEILMLPSGPNVFLDYEKKENTVNNNVSMVPNGKSNVYVSSTPPPPPPQQHMSHNHQQSDYVADRKEEKVPHCNQYLIPTMSKINNANSNREDFLLHSKTDVKKINNNVLRYKTSIKKFIEEEKGDESDEGCEIRPVFDPGYPIVFQIVMSDHSYVQPVPLFGDTTDKPVMSFKKEDDNDSLISSDGKSDDEGEETETAAEGEESITRCICDLEHDDGYMVCCDKCSVWQHVACVFPDMKGGETLPEEFLCDACHPRKLDRNRARTMQLQKRKQIFHHLDSSDSSSSSLESPIKSKGAKKAVARRRAEPVQRKPSKSESVAYSTKSAPNKLRRNSTAVKSEQPVKSTVVSTTTSSNSVGRRTKIKRKMERKLHRRRKSKTKEEKDGENVTNNNTTSVASTSGLQNSKPPANALKDWIENYEEAVANHYSAELKNRLKEVKNTTSCDLSIRSGAAVKCRLSQLASGEKVLVATSSLSSGQSIIEIKGEFMLVDEKSPETEWMFYYKIPKDGTEVVVDVSNYGNCSRFVRRSCKPNAQLKHCMEKNNLRLYLVATTNLDKNQEITVAHNSWLDKSQACSCGKDCQLNSSKSNLNTSTVDRRRRGRRRTTSGDSEGRAASIKTKRDVVGEPRRNSSAAQLSPVSPIYSEANKDKDRKLTRDERKIEQAMKIFAQMERDTAKKKDKGPTEPIAGSSSSKKGSQSKPDSDKDIPEPKTSKKSKKKKGRNNSSTETVTRRLRFNSADNNQTSDDEKPIPVRPKRSSRDSRESRTNPVKEKSDRTLRKRSTVTRESRSNSRDRDDAAGTLLALSEAMTPPPVDIKKESESETSPPTPMSSACILVAAAMGPFDPGFKFPKTKRGLMNQWLSNQPEVDVSNSDISPQPSTIETKNVTLPPGAPKPSNLSSRLFCVNEINETRNIELSENKVKSGGGCAKKRWLRQAISEESEVPCASLTSPTVTDMTPLKKRRLARESVSSDVPPPPTAKVVERNGEFNSSESPYLETDIDSETSYTEHIDPLRSSFYDNENQTQDKPLDLTNERDKRKEFILPEVDDTKYGKNIRKQRVKRTPSKKLNCQSPVDFDKLSKKRRNDHRENDDNDIDDVEKTLRDMESGGQENFKKEPHFYIETSYTNQIILDQNYMMNSGGIKAEPAETLDVTYNSLTAADNIKINMEKIKFEKSSEEDKFRYVERLLEAEDYEKDGSSSLLREDSGSNDKSDSSDKICDGLMKDYQDSGKSKSPIKRKLSITEYLKRKKGVSKKSDLSSVFEESPSSSTTPPQPSSPHSDDEKSIVDMPTPTLRPIFLGTQIMDKPGATVRFKPEPTSLELQRENLTQRLRREFGLHVSEDDPKVLAETEKFKHELNLRENEIKGDPLAPLPSKPPPILPVHYSPDPCRFGYFYQQPLPQSAIYPVGSSNPPNPNIAPFSEIPHSTGERKSQIKK